MSPSGREFHRPDRLLVPSSADPDPTGRFRDGAKGPRHPCYWSLAGTGCVETLIE